jgi:hypothetical protein
MAFYNTPGMSLTDIVYAFLEVVIANNGPTLWNKAAYNASWAAAASTYAPNVDPVIYDSEWRHSAYQFCNSSKYGTCSILAFNSYGDLIFDQSLTEYMFLVQDGSCSSSGQEQFMINPVNFDSIISNPPVEIVESYYECTMTPYDSMFNAIGVAGGNIGIAVPLIMFFCLPLMYGWMKITGTVQPQPEYEKIEKEAALDLLALQLLRIRDGRVRGMKVGGELLKVGKELVSAAHKADGGYPDSDDSDSNSDDEDGDGDGIVASKRKSTRKAGAREADANQPDLVEIRRSSLRRFSERRFIGGGTAPDSDDEDGATGMPAPQFETKTDESPTKERDARRNSRRMSRKPPPPPERSGNPLHAGADAPANSRLTGMYEL